MVYWKFSQNDSFIIFLWVKMGLIQNLLLKPENLLVIHCVRLVMIIYLKSIVVDNHY